MFYAIDPPRGNATSDSRDSLGRGSAMVQDEGCDGGDAAPAANDNGGVTASARIDQAVIRIAQLIGRQMAREQFKCSSPANDNSPPERGHE
jgi:hypothetical protein